MTKNLSPRRSFYAVKAFGYFISRKIPTLLRVSLGVDQHMKFSMLLLIVSQLNFFIPPKKFLSPIVDIPYYHCCIVSRRKTLLHCDWEMNGLSFSYISFYGTHNYSVNFNFRFFLLWFRFITIWFFVAFPIITLTLMTTVICSSVSLSHSLRFFALQTVCYQVLTIFDSEQIDMKIYHNVKIQTQ